MNILIFESEKQNKTVNADKELERNDHLIVLVKIIVKKTEKQARGDCEAWHAWQKDRILLES